MELQRSICKKADLKKHESKNREHGYKVRGCRYNEKPIINSAISLSYILRFLLCKSTLKESLLSRVRRW